VATRFPNAPPGRSAYSAYGRSLSDLPEAESFGYAGRERDLDDLYYYRARYYSTALGRFISEDPTGFDGNGVNFHAYVNGDPISEIDPLGLRPLTDCEKRILGPYIPQEDLDKADVHDGHVPWYLPDDMDGITRGRDIYFRPGAYPYGTPAGFKILAHELVHVGQYREGMTWVSYFWSVRKGYAENSKYEKLAYDMGSKVRRDLQNMKNPCNCGEGEP
jgi:RHS repeat-associated protein